MSTRADLLERNEFIYAARIAGQTYASIGRQFELTRERIRQIVAQLKRRKSVLPEFTP